MTYHQSLWDLFQARNLSRRQFIKTCCILTGMMGLSLTAVPEVTALAKKQPLVHVIWLHGQACTGCSEALTRSREPLAADILLKAVSLDYDSFLAAAAAAELEQHRETLMHDFAGKYLVIAEGSIPVGDGECSCMIGGVPYVNILQETAKQAAAVVAVGSCASWGGIQAARPNPSHSLAVDQVVVGKPILKIPGCPPIPEVLASIIMYFTLFGQLPPVDRQGRPLQFFGNPIHDRCCRKPFFEAGQFVEQYDDKGSRKGWCLYKMGCRGPETFNACSSTGWWQGLSYPARSGAACIGCSSSGFWDNDPFTSRLTEE